MVDDSKSETKQRKVQVLQELPHRVQQMEHFKEHKMNMKKSLMPVLSSLKESKTGEKMINDTLSHHF